MSISAPSVHSSAQQNAAATTAAHSSAASASVAARTSTNDSFERASVSRFAQASTTAVAGDPWQAAADRLAIDHPEVAALLNQKVTDWDGNTRSAAEALGVNLEKAQAEIDWQIANEQLPDGEDPYKHQIWFLTTVANRLVPNGFPGRVDIFKMAFSGMASNLDQDLQEMAQMAGDSPFGMERSWEAMETLLPDAIQDVVDQLDATDEQKVMIVKAYVDASFSNASDEIWDNAPHMEMHEPSLRKVLVSYYANKISKR